MAEIKTVGIVGAGQMGSGIAHVSALGGYKVLFHDVSRERIDEGVALTRRNMGRQVAKGLLSETDVEAAMARVVPTPAKEDVAKADLVIEAATENEDVKKAIFKGLVPYL